MAQSESMTTEVRGIRLRLFEAAHDDGLLIPTTEFEASKNSSSVMRRSKQINYGLLQDYVPTVAHILVASTQVPHHEPSVLVFLPEPITSLLHRASNSCPREPLAREASGPESKSSIQQSSVERYAKSKKEIFKQPRPSEVGV